MTFKELFDSYNKVVFNLALQYVQHQEDAEEITQNVFVKIYAKIDTFQQQSDLKTWIYRITINQSLDFIKAQNARKRWSFFSARSINDDTKKIDVPHFDHPSLANPILLKNTSRLSKDSTEFYTPTIFCSLSVKHFFIKFKTKCPYSYFSLYSRTKF